MWFFNCKYCSSFHVFRLALIRSSLFRQAKWQGENWRTGAYARRLQDISSEDSMDKQLSNEDEDRDGGDNVAISDCEENDGKEENDTQSNKE